MYSVEVKFGIWIWNNAVLHADSTKNVTVTVEFLNVSHFKMTESSPSIFEQTTTRCKISILI